MNLETLAKLAGVSVATVSKAFAGSGEISEETRKRIFGIARENGCFDKYNKNRFGKKVFAVICPEVKSEYYSAILTAFDKEITARGGIMAVSVTDFSPERENELFTYYASYCKADGIILVNQRCFIENALRVPAVSVFPSREAAGNENMDDITSDMLSSIRKAVLYLKENGHRAIGFAGERLTMSKLEGFKTAMREAGLAVTDEYIKVSDLRFEEAGMEIMDAWLASGKAPGAILAAYDYIAIGIVKSLRCAGYEVPRDFTVIGMDDISVIPYLDTPLSSIKTHVDEACRAAVELILKKIDNRYYRARQGITVPSEFIPRGGGNVPLQFTRGGDAPLQFTRGKSD